MEAPSVGGAFFVCPKGKVIPILVERKVAAGSIAAAMAAGLVQLAVFVGKKFGIEIDPLVALPVATTLVVYVVTFLAGYAAKHTHRPELDEQIEGWAGIEPEVRDMPEPTPVDESDAPNVAQDA